MGKGGPQLMDVSEGESKPAAVQEWLELPNGCICCTAKDNLILALENLVSERRAKFDYIFVETTGMADPGPLAKILWVDEGLGSRIYLDAVVTLVDAKHILHHLHGTSEGLPNESFQPRKLEALRQIALSDIVLVNKMDLVQDEEQRKRIETELRQINGLAKFFFTERSRIDISNIMEINSFDGNKLSSGMAEVEKAHESHDHEPSHSEGVNTIVLKVMGEVTSTEAVTKWFAELLWEAKLPIYRIKGELAVAGDDRRYIVQGVYDNFEIQPTEWKWNDVLPVPTFDTKGGSSSKIDPKATTKRCVLVMIGQDLGEKTLFESFSTSCFAQ